VKSLFALNISTSFRILFGILFVAAALFKLYPVEHFEILLVKAEITSWCFSPILARIIIGYELLIGFFLIFNIYLKRILWVSIITLLIFSAFLVYVHYFIGDTTNCGCFGSILPLTPVQSIIKNLVLLLIGSFLVFKSDYKIWYWAKYQRYIVLFVITMSLGLPFILSRVDFPGEKTSYKIEPGKKVKSEKLEQVEFNTITVNLLEGRKLICFYSMACSVCKVSASKIALIYEQSNNQLPIYIIFLDNENKDQLLSKFFQDTGANDIPYTIFQPKAFFEISDNSIPFLMYLDNGEIKNLSNYRDMSPEYVIDFLEGRK